MQLRCHPTPSKVYASSAWVTKKRQLADALPVHPVRPVRPSRIRMPLPDLHDTGICSPCKPDCVLCPANCVSGDIGLTPLVDSILCGGLVLSPCDLPWSPCADKPASCADVLLGVVVGNISPCASDLLPDISDYLQELQDAQGVKRALDWFLNTSDFGVMTPLA